MHNLQNYLDEWNLSEATKIDVQSAASDVFIVNAEDEQVKSRQKAVLKLLNADGVEDEKYGVRALDWFGGEGAVKALKHDKGAHLLEYLDGPMLVSLVDEGKDEEATRIICEVIKKIHSASEGEKQKPELLPLRDRFNSLFEQAQKTEDEDYETFAKAAEIAEGLLRTTDKEVVLHGDVHHENILGSVRGWLAIDPKGLIGDPVYDVANVFNNPLGRNELVGDPERINKLANIFAEELGFDKQRVLQFVASYMALSASWHLSSGAEQEARSTLKNCRTVLSLLIP